MSTVVHKCSEKISRQKNTLKHDQEQSKGNIQTLNLEKEKLANLTSLLTITSLQQMLELTHWMLISVTEDAKHK